MYAKKSFISLFFRFVCRISRSMSASAIVLPKVSSRKTLSLYTIAVHVVMASCSSGFCGRSMIWVGLICPINSNIFFFPSQVVSPMIACERA